MSDNATPQNEHARAAILRAIWEAQAAALLAALKGDPTAATLNVARQFLMDNGINADALRHGNVGHMRASLASLPFAADTEGDTE